MKLEDFGRKIGGLEHKYPKKFLWLMVAFTLVMIPGLLQMKIEPSLEKVLPQDLGVLKEMNYMRDQFGADMVYTFVDTKGSVYSDVRNPEILKQVESANSKISHNENILQINSVTDMVRDYNDGVIPEDYGRVKEIFEQAKVANDPRVNLVNHDYTILITEIRTNTGSNAEAIAGVVDGIRSDVEDSNQLGLEVGLTGYNALDKATFEVILSDFSYTTFLSFLFIAIIVYITFGSFTKGMIPMVIVMFSLLWTNGTVGYMGISMTVASMGAAAMVMGLGIDFGMHLLSLFNELIEQGKSIKEAIELTIEKDIRAIVGTSITTIAGFISLWFSSLPAMVDLGTILVIGIFYSMIAALFGIMPLLYLYEKKQVKKVVG